MPKPKTTTVQPDEIRRAISDLISEVESSTARADEQAAGAEAERLASLRRGMRRDAEAARTSAEEIDRRLESAPPADLDETTALIRRRDEKRIRAEALEKQAGAMKDRTIPAARDREKMARIALGQTIEDLARRRIIDAFGPALTADLRRITECAVAASSGLAGICHQYDVHLSHLFPAMLPLSVRILREAFEISERQKKESPQ